MLALALSSSIAVKSSGTFPANMSDCPDVVAESVSDGEDGPSSFQATI